MEVAEILNVIELALNILGVCLIFFFGLPQPSHDEKVSLTIGRDTVLADGRSVKGIIDKIIGLKVFYTAC